MQSDSHNFMTVYKIPTYWNMGPIQPSANNFSAFVASMDNLFQCSVLIVENFFIMCNLNHSYFSLKPLLFVLIGALHNKVHSCMSDTSI